MIVKNKNNIFRAVSAITMFFWLSFLYNTDSYYSVYLLVGITSFISLFSIKTTKKSIVLNKDRILMYTFSSIFSIAVILANYRLFDFMFEGGVRNIIAGMCSILFMVAGGFFTAYNILKFINRLLEKEFLSYEINFTPIRLFWICFAIFSVINISVLLLCYIPGNLTPDSINEISQMYSGDYSNHHPFYFTVFVQLFFNLGTTIFGSANAGVLLYSIVQLLIMGLIFSFGIMTMYQCRVPKYFIMAAFLLYALMPYHIMYSFTVWKDILFGGFVLLFIITIARALTQNKSIWNFLLMIISCFGICLFRSNGWAAFIIAVILSFAIFKKKYLSISIMLLLVSVLSYILKGPVLTVIGVRQPDTIESLSIPTQQIARVIVDDKNSLTEDQKSLINNLANIDEIAAVYNPILHDPIKDIVRANGNQQYLNDHKFDFAKLYLELGFSHPAEYIKAWVDQTRGYWNGGYRYWIWADDVYENNFNITRKVNSDGAKKIFNNYAQSFYVVGFLQPFISIGFWVWILWLSLYISIKQHKKVLLFVCVLLLSIWGSLLIATPVFAEFRYIYSLFCCLPFIPIFIFSNDSGIKKNAAKNTYLK